MTDRVGQQLGNYLLIRLLGRGGFADVYLGEHIHLNTLVAVKVLHTKLTNDDIEEFRTEARIIARLIHPSIIRVFDFGVENGVPFLVMDYAPNGTLRQQHPKGVPLPLMTIVSYVKQVAAALQYIHDEKLVHRDVKPENMLVGQRNEILLSDFGIAVVSQSSHYQNTQEVVGTVAYMSPEQLHGKPRAASDQYALGVVVYEWLCGDRPFRGSFAEQYSQHMFAPPPPLRERVPNISPAVEIVVLTALAKEPQQRFATVQAFANALEQASKFVQPISMPLSSNPLLRASPDSITPTDVISMLPTAPVILPATQPQDAPPLPSSIPPLSPPAVKEKTPPLAPSPDSSVSNLPTIHVPLEPPVSLKKQTPPVAPSIDKCPYCGAETRPGEIFCLSCGNRLLAATPSFGDATIPGSDNWADAGDKTVAPSIDKCPYCGAETRPGEIFCLSCGNRLLSATPSSQQAQPIIGGDATHPAFSNDRAVAAQGGRAESLIGSFFAPSVVSPWNPNLDASIILPDEQVEAKNPSATVLESSASSPLPTGLGSTVAPDQAKEQRLKEGDAYYKAKRYEEALAVYEKVIQMDSHDARAYSNKGNALRKLKRYKEALHAYEHALTIDPNNAFIWTSKGNVLYALKRSDEALVAYERALVINSNNAFIWASKGNVLYALKRYYEALDAYDSALTIAPDDASIWTAKGEVFYRQKRYREALDAYDRALAIAPDDAGIWTAKSNKLYKLKRYDEVLTTYERILSIIPINAPIWSSKGNVLYQVGRYDEALDAYNKALTITPRKARIWSDKGAVLYKLELYDEALDAYKFAQFLDPKDTSISHRYDMLCDRLLDLKRRQEEHEQKQAPEQRESKTPSSGDRPGGGQPSHAVPPHQEKNAGGSQPGHAIPSHQEKNAEAKKAGGSQPGHAVPPHQEKNAEAKKAGAESKQYDVFLSHSHTDTEWVERNLAMRLVDEHGFRVWLDKWMLIPGQSFLKGMAHGIDQAYCCAVCIGEHTPVGWFKQEIQRALNRQVKDPSFRVFAILLPGATNVNVDDFLELNTWVDFRSSDTAYAFHVLVSGVRGEPPGRWPPEETPTMRASVDVETKLRELHRFKQENWVDPSLAVEFQRTVLKKLWLDFDESKEQQE